MSTEIAVKRPSERFQKLYGSHPESLSVSASKRVQSAVVVAIAIGFVLLGGGGLEPTTDMEARIGLTAHESIGPFAQTLGEFDTSIAPATAWLMQLAAKTLGGTPTIAAVRWPSTFAALGIALILMRRVGSIFGQRAGVFAMLAACGSLAMIDKSATTGFDFPLGLALIATLDRILSRGADWTAGLLAAIAVLFGGWPALATILLPLIVIGRPGSMPSFRLIAPPVIAFVAWSVWAISTVKTVVWAAAMTLPFTRPIAWNMGLWTIAFALPFVPFAVLTIWSSIRKSQDTSLVLDWLKIAAVGLLAGTILPGFAVPCTILLFCGLIVASAVSLDAAWSGELAKGPRNAALSIGLLLGLFAGGVSVYAGANLAVSQPYYRGVGIVLIGIGIFAALVGLDSAWMRSTRGAVRALIVVAVAFKVAHFGVYLPERDYRFGKGPWGRAVGQYVPPNWPIYTFHDISPSLAFATEHPVHKLRAEIFLTVQPGNGPKFVLLQESEFVHWPSTAPKLQKVRAFQDEYGGTRVLARTEGRLQRREIDN